MWQVFADKRCQNWDMTNPRCVDYPALTAWIANHRQPSLMRFERTPTTSKSTPRSAAPYIDYILSTVNDFEMVTLKVVAGEGTSSVNLPPWSRSRSTKRTRKKPASASC